jgi:lipopolysaccharide export LptBFGC system permease protein LptF
VLLVGFGVLGLVTALLAGAPAEWSFLLFAVGLLLMPIAAVPLALGLRRAGGLGGWWITVLVAGAGALVALGAAADPWHDLGLFVFFAAWLALGIRLVSRSRRRHHRVATG